MKKAIIKSIFFIVTLFLGVILGVLLSNIPKSWLTLKSFYGNNRDSSWDNAFGVANIMSSKDGNNQKAYYYKTQSKLPKPLIVSLHTWNGNYAQYDALATLCRNRDLNYIHPNFRGPNNSSEACCSDLALSDIDDAISYALDNFNVDNNEIYVIGLSGGGYATLSSFMKSKHNIKKFSAWAPISDLVVWYKESQILGNSIYTRDILKCTMSGDKLNIDAAQRKSPINWKTPTHKLDNQELKIYAGVYDGIQGSVPITHSINFYNKILKDLCVSDSIYYVSNKEKLFLLENREPLKSFGYLSNRKIFLKKTYNNISLEIFEGEHEILPEYALNNLLGSN